MPRYYFHIRSGQVTIIDRRGVDLSELADAAKEAARRALQIESSRELSDAPSNGAVLVEDEYSTLLEVPLMGGCRAQ
jgi:hypothetical protein